MFTKYEIKSYPINNSKKEQRKNELYDTLKDNIYCPLCKKLMIHPVMCMSCLNIYCNKCSDEMKEGKIKKWKSKNII